MFTGEFFHNIDRKGRLIIPAKFRYDLGETFYLGKGFDKSLLIYPEDTWNEFTEKLKKLSILSTEHRYFSRRFLSGFNECSIDKQGRILVPPNLREYSEMNEETVIIGVLDRIEIWNKDNWNIYSNADDMDFNEIAEKMNDLGLDL
ncbi:MAG: division/cell wall cluster transcriptional repressor MraZ [Eubacteriales bacterium]